MGPPLGQQDQDLDGGFFTQATPNQNGTRRLLNFLKIVKCLKNETNLEILNGLESRHHNTKVFTLKQPIVKRKGDDMTKVKVGVNGYGVIGKRVADAVSLQSDMKLVGISDVASDYRVQVAVKKGYPIYASVEEAAPEMRKAGIKIAGTLSDLLKEVDVVVDATPKGIGAKNKALYEGAGVKATFQGGENPWESPIWPVVNMQNVRRPQIIDITDMTDELNSEESSKNQRKISMRS